MKFYVLRLVLGQMDHKKHIQLLYTHWLEPLDKIFTYKESECKIQNIYWVKYSCKKYHETKYFKTKYPKTK